MSIEQDLKKLDRRIETLIQQRNGHTVQAEALQEQIRDLRCKKLQVAQEGLLNCGLDVDITQNPGNERSSPRCSICVKNGLAGEGHTAARHHLLLVRGELPGLTTEEEAK